MRRSTYKKQRNEKTCAQKRRNMCRCVEAHAERGERNMRRCVEAHTERGRRGTCVEREERNMCRSTHKKEGTCVEREERNMRRSTYKQERNMCRSTCREREERNMCRSIQKKERNHAHVIVHSSIRGLRMGKKLTIFEADSDIVVAPLLADNCADGSSRRKVCRHLQAHHAVSGHCKQITVHFFGLLVWKYH